MVARREPHIEQVYRRALQRGEHGLAQVWFDAAVLDKYRGAPAFAVIRTDTIGRLSRQRVWSLDFGIAAGDALIHASLQDLLQRLPEDEREHWARHVVTPPVSGNFLRTQLAPGSCIDDGELRPW
ncbi:MAG: hypothetical protein HY689_05765 [Chloroflexi bacterium]|nr:hypothetical protein [Chloroflexota bacterium]